MAEECLHMLNDSIAVRELIGTLAKYKNDAEDALFVARDALTEINKCLRKCATSFHQIVGYEYLGKYDDLNVEKIMAEIDKSLWNTAISQSGILEILAHGAKEKLDKKFAEEPRPFSFESASSLLDALARDAPILRGASIKEVFDTIAKARFRRGNHWRGGEEKRAANEIPRDVRWSHFGDLGGYWSCHNAQRADFFSDLEMVCGMLAQTPKVSYPNRCGDIIKDKMLKYNATFPATFDGEFFALTVYKCGNVRLKFKNEEVLALLNRYGASGRPFLPVPKSNTSKNERDAG
jgi:hypothetical protein